MILRIKNWEKFQHYKNRRPPWIKLHFGILSSKDWVCGTDQERVLAIACMLLASQSDDADGRFEADPEYFKRVAYLRGAIDFNPLIKRGFLEVLADASERLQMISNATPEVEERRGEKEIEEESAQKSRDPRHQEFSGHAYKTFEEKHCQPPTWGAKEFSALKVLLNKKTGLDYLEFARRWSNFLFSTEEFTQSQGDSLGYFCNNFDRFLEGPVERRGTNGPATKAEQRTENSKRAIVHGFGFSDVAPDVRPSLPSGDSGTLGASVPRNSRGIHGGTG